MKGTPKSILFATDLSARCDRALDRALSLSQHWQAKLAVLHVLETSRSEGSIVPSWRRPPNPATVAKGQLLADIGPKAKTARVLVEEGDPAEVIVHVAESQRCDLILTGVARDEPFGRFFLGTTVDRLLQRSRIPVLVVRNRVRHSYRHVAIATDFSEPSRYAIETAVRFFPKERVTIFHAYDPPMSGLTDDPAAYRQKYRVVAENDYEKFLKSIKSGVEIKKRARSFIEFGRPADILREGVRDMNIDLVTLGTHGRGAFAEVLLGSVAKQIMAEVPCDSLVIRAP